MVMCPEGINQNSLRKFFELEGFYKNHKIVKLENPLVIFFSCLLAKNKFFEFLNLFGYIKLYMNF